MDLLMCHPPMADNAAHESLTNTLVLALTQCQDQVRALEESGRTIARLQKENETLRQELEDARAIARQTDTTSGDRAELERLYQRDFDKQAQIDQLRQKLKIVKIKAQQRGLVDAISSSPLPFSSAGRISPKATSVSSSPGVPALKLGSKDGRVMPASTASASEMPLPPPRKRARTQSPGNHQPLREVSGNAIFANTKQKSGNISPKRQRRSDRVSAAVPVAVADREDYQRSVQRAGSEKRTNRSYTSAYERLHDLMSAPTPTRPPLLQPSASSIAPPNAMEIHDSSAAKLTFPNSKTKSTTMDIKSKSRPSIAEASPMTAPEDEEPFRSRPLSRLDLSHFKLNPVVNDGLQHAYHEVIRGRKERKCMPGCTKPECCGGKFSVLAATLPDMPGTIDMSEDELLTGYLGPNSGEKIKNLTPVARANLLHEARTKLVANLYGKMHRDTHERGRSPPGYWSTDMPGSQEHQQLREQARLLERDEIRRRYQEAKKDGGRWIFADE